MAVPIKEDIAVNILAAINAVTVANDFNQDLTGIRPRRNDFSDVMPTDKTVLIKQADINKPGEQAISTVEWNQRYSLSAIVIDDDDEADSIDTRLNQVEADIQKKLMEDPTRGGNAIDTIILPSMEFYEVDGFTGIEINIVVKYRTEIEDPYTRA